MLLRRSRRRRRGAQARAARRPGVGQTVKGVVKADSPLFRQYQNVKEQHPDKLLFFRMGDFYELFYDDARQVSALLGLTLTRRRTSDADIPMAGVPVASCANHIARLARMGETVALCDQVAPASGGSGLMERRVTQIVTPGTLVEAEFLDERQACVAMAVAPERRSVGYAWLDLARGELRAGEADPGALPALYARLAPAELLAPEGFVYEGRHSLALRQLPPWEFSPTAKVRALRERFGVADLRGFGLEDAPRAAAAAAVLLDYAESVQCQAIDHVWKIGRDRPEASIAMDAAARRSLEIAEPLAEGGPTLLGAVDRCQTGMGARLLARLLRDPPRDHGVLRRRMAASQALAPRLAGLRRWLEGRCDLERVATRVALGRARPAELAGVRGLLADLPALQEELPPAVADAGFAAAIAADYAGPASLLAERLAAEPRPGAAVAPGCSERLDRLRAVQKDAAGIAAGIEEEERERGAGGFKLGHSRAHGYFFECHRSKAVGMPPHFERIQATKNAERFVTPALRRLHAEAVGAAEEGAELEKELYAGLQEALAVHGRELRALADALAALDVALNMALLAAERGWTWPKLRDDPGVVIEGGRHAVIEGAVEYFVDNDTSLEPAARAELITGPNMGGKSTYMRQVALIVLLAHAGAPVPARAAAVGPVDSIMTRIGASDDLAGGRSTFMVEMSEVASILRQAGPQSLVILDEVGRGTSVADGLALAWAALRALLERNRALVLLATHYLELARLAAGLEGVRCRHLAVSAADGKVVMLHKVSDGIQEKSYGIHVAGMAGVPPHVLDCAREFAGQLPAAPPPAAAAPRADRLRERLRLADLDALSPRQALDLLYELRDLDLEG